MIARLAIMGVGLIGGSLALALKAAGACAEIVGTGRRIETLRRAQMLGVIDRYELDLASAVNHADMVVLATPLSAMEACLAEMAGALAEHTVFTDVGSTKLSVVAALRRARPAPLAHCVPGHPIAGAEQSGVAAARADLFQDRRVVLTPLPESAPAATARVRAMWQAAGAEVVMLDAAQHDAVLAATSHLPHALAYAYVASLAPRAAALLGYTGSGFRDFTRIAAGDAVLWRDISLANRTALRAALIKFREVLDALDAALAAQDGTALQDLYLEAQALRAQFINHQGASHE